MIRSNDSTHPWVHRRNRQSHTYLSLGLVHIHAHFFVTTRRTTMSTSTRSSNEWNQNSISQQVITIFRRDRPPHPHNNEANWSARVIVVEHKEAATPAPCLEQVDLHQKHILIWSFKRVVGVCATSSLDASFHDIDKCWRHLAMPSRLSIDVLD